MKTRGWALSAAFMVGLLAVSSQAVAAGASSTAGDILKPLSIEERTELQRNVGKQMEIVSDLANNIAPNNPQLNSQLNAVMVEGTEQTFLPQVNAALTNANAQQRDSAAYHAIRALFGPDNWTRAVVANPRPPTAEEAVALVNSLTGYAGTAAVNAGIDTAKFNSGMIHNRQEELRSEMRSGSYDSCGYGSVDFANRIWATPFHNNISQKDKDDLTGYKYKMSGISLGYDRIVGAFSVGAALTYSRGDYEWRDTSDDNKIDNYGASVYMQYYNQSGFFAGLDAGYNHGRNDWERDLLYMRAVDTDYNGSESGKNNTNTYWVGGTLGYDFSTCNNFSLTPTVGLYWYDARSSALNTRMGGERTPSSFINYGKMKKKALILPVELTAAYTREINDCSSLSLKATGGYTYNFKKKGARGDTGVFDDPDTWTTRGMENARHGWKAGAGVNYSYKQFDFGVDYLYEGAKKLSAHSVSANFGVRF